MRPIFPLLRKIFFQQFGNSFPIIGNKASPYIAFFACQFKQMIFELISPTTSKLFEKIGSPIGSVHFIRIIEKSLGCRCSGRSKGPIETGKIICHRLLGEMVHYISFSPGSRPFYLLKRFSQKCRNKFPLFTFGCRPVQLSGFLIDPGSKIQNSPVGRICHQTQ